MPADAVITIVMIMCLALIIQAVNLPLMFWIGVEKGRMLFILLTVVGMTVFMTALTGMDLSIFFIEEKYLIAGGVLLTIVCNVISYQISKKIYTKKVYS